MHMLTTEFASARCTSSMKQAPPASSSNGASAAPAQRGKDGHLTLGFNNDDFFKDPLAARTGSSGTAGRGMGGYGSGPAQVQPQVEAVAQKRFANAKAISSE
jgi:hypothetical protein